MSHARRGRASIASLPAELLLIILKIVYVETREGLPMIWPHQWCQALDECKCNLNEPYLTKWNDRNDLKSLSVFPYALSAVCKEWSDLMLLVPEFWTRLIIFVDTQPTAIADLRAQLSVSRDLPFQAHIFNRQDAACRDVTEGARVQAVIDELFPYLHRCERLTFDVMHNSSLPSIRGNFSGSYPLLTGLSMECKIHDAHPQESNIASEPRKEPFLFPNLNCVVLTGSAFADAYYENPNWLRGIEMRKLRRFSISHLSSVDIPDLSLRGFLSILNEFQGRAASFELKYVDLPQRPEEEIPANWEFRVGFGSLLLEGFKKETLEEFNKLISTSDYESQTIKSCELSGGCMNYSFYLNLEDIKSTDDLLSVVPTLSNRSIKFIYCPGLNDTILEQLSMPDPDTGTWHLETLKNLSISGSSGISVPALKALVESRTVESAKRGYGTNPRYDDFDEMSPLDSLYISCCGLDFSLEDVEWFKEKVKYFSFHV